jgi:NitT/TauT family transport system substrate-binding protein
MIHPFSRLVAAGVAVTASLLIAGCTSKAASAAPVSVEKPDLTVAAVPAAGSAALYIAQQRGMFAAEGLHVKIVPINSSSAAIAGQLAGTYDVTVGGYVAYILADAQHRANLRVLAAASMLRPFSQEIVVPAGSPIETISELKGKSIGVNALNNVGMLLVSSVLSDAGMSPSEVHFVSIPFSKMAAALQAHQVDAAYLPEPFLTSAEMSIGAQPIVDTDQGATENFPISGYVVTQAWVHKYPRTATAFRRAVLAAQGLAGNSLSAVQQAMMASAGVPRLAATLMAAPEFPVDAEPIVLQRVADMMLKFGLLHQQFSVAPMLR